jgi:O-antigen/teichoic acid export membrane protein
MKLFHSNLLQNISTVAASTLMTQAAMLMVIPLLTRLYSPAAFGMFATFSAIHALCVIMFSLKYDVAIILPHDNLEARNGLALSVLFPTILSLLLACGLIGYVLITNGANWYLLLLPVSIIFASVYSAFQQWGARHREYRHYSISQIVNAAFNIIACATIGLMLAGLAEGLVLGFTSGLIFSAIYMLWVYRSVLKTAPPANGLISLLSLRKTAWAYRHLPIKVLPFTILTVIFQSGAPLVLNANYELTEIGLYAVATRALLAPSAIIASAIGEPFRAELAARARSGVEIISITRKLLLVLFAISAAAFSVMYFIAPPFFAWLFGPEFSRSGDIARALCLGAFIQFIILPVNQVFVIAGKMKDGLISQTIVAFVPLVALWFASNRLPIEEALLIWSAAMFSAGFGMIILVYRAARSFDTSTIKGMA